MIISKPPFLPCEAINDYLHLQTQTAWLGFESSLLIVGGIRTSWVGTVRALAHTKLEVEVG
jgi:hypothetical protein